MNFLTSSVLVKLTMIVECNIVAVKMMNELEMLNNGAIIVGQGLLSHQISSLWLMTGFLFLVLVIVRSSMQEQPPLKLL